LQIHLWRYGGVKYVVLPSFSVAVAVLGLVFLGRVVFCLFLILQGVWCPLCSKKKEKKEKEKYVDNVPKCHYNSI
jgi:hypothetical protein